MTAFARALVAAVSLVGQAGQVSSLTGGVYSNEQAGQGREMYRAQCTECHGVAMEGGSGPPLAGEDFLANWSARPLVTLVGKIQNTMPFDKPGTLSRSQSTALLAYMLQIGKFPAGAADLSDDVLARVTFPMTRTAPASAAVASRAASLPPPEGNLAELMRAIAFPNSNI